MVNFIKFRHLKGMCQTGQAFPSFPFQAQYLFLLNTSFRRNYLAGL